jgi:tetratricopeptide (TPR) repeat protein
MTALTWSYAKHYDNAEKKYKEALLDVEHALFPNEEEKILAIANIYNDLSEYVYKPQSQFAKIIAYQNVIVALTGDELSDNVRCKIYSDAQLYQEAIQECTDRIKQQGSSIIDAYLYRADDYKGLGKREEALQDYAVVADSDNSYYRTYAAIEMSVLYTNDPNAMLRTFEKYPFLFDEDYQIRIHGKKVGKHKLSIGYNNRCYAYMQLGEYQKALDDCTTSLKYDNLPDAYQKQQELIKKLSPTPAAPVSRAQ